MKFSNKDLFSKCGQIHSFLRITSYLLKKSLIWNFLFCAVWPPYLLQAFEVFDQNGDGTISAEVLRDVMTKVSGVMTNEEAEEIVRAADKDKNGVIDYESGSKIAQ